MAAAIPIDLGQVVSAEDTSTTAANVINVMTDPQGANRLRPGIVNTQLDSGKYAATSGTNTNVIGMFVWLNPIDQFNYLIYVRADRTIWAKNLFNNVTTALSDATAATQLSGANRPVFAADTIRVVIAGGAEIQMWTGTGLSARIAAFSAGSNQPPQFCTHVASLANYLIANNYVFTVAAFAGQANQMFWSALGDGAHTSWPPLNFNTADADPDPIVGIYANLRELFVFGDKTLQVYGVSSDPLLPFAASSAIKLGLGGPYSVVALDDSFAFLDHIRRLVVSDGRSKEVISDDIQQIINGYDTVSDCFGFRCKISFWDLLIWVFPAEGKAWAYNQATKKWCQWRGWNGADDFAAIRIGAYAYYRQANQHIIGDPLFENLWTLDPDAIGDPAAGLPVVSERITPRLDWDTDNRKRRKYVRLYLKRGTTSINGTAPLLECSKKDDGGPWSEPVTLSLGVDGDTKNWIDWYPGGIYRRTQYKFRYSGAAELAISKAIEDFTEMTS